MKKYSFLLLAVALSLCTNLFAQGSFKPEDVHKWTESHSIPANLKVGDEITLNFTCKMDDGYHLYSANQPVAKTPIKPLLFILDKTASGVELVGNVIDGPGKKTEKDDVFLVEVSYYEKTATFSQKIKIIKENPILEATLKYQICNDFTCIPSEYSFKTPLKLVTGKAPANEPNNVKDSLPTGQIKEVPATSEEQNSILNGIKWTTTILPSTTVAPKIGDTLTIIMHALIEPSIQLLANNSTNQLPYFELVENQSKGFEEVGDLKIKGKKKTDKGKIIYTDSVTIIQKLIVKAENPVFKGSLSYFVASNGKVANGKEDIIPAFVWANAPKVETNVPPKVDEKGKDEGCDLWKLILKGLGFGILAAFTPCFYPMIPLTVSYFTKQSSSRRRGIFNALFYGFSIITIFTVLVIGITLIFGVTALNAIATNGWVNIALFILIFAFGLSFLGWFDMSLPESWSTKISSRATTSSLPGIFFMALTLVIVSFSCTGVFVAQLLGGIGGGGNMWCIIIPMLAFSSTLALPFILFAIFPSLLHSIPKSGGWLGTFKVTLGFLEMALAFSYLSNTDLVWHLHILPRELYLGIWIAIAFALGLYLLGFLKIDKDYQPESISVPRLLLALTILTLGFYMIPGMFGRQIKLFDSIAIIPPIAAGEGAENHNKSSSKADFTTADICNYPNKKYTHINEYTHDGICAFYDLDQGLEYAKQKNMPVLLDFTGYACKNCRKVEQTIWTDAVIKKMLQEDYVLVSLFVDDGLKLDKVEVSSNGKELETLGDKLLDYEKRVYNVPAQPYYVLLDHDNTPLLEPFGYAEAPDVATYKKNLETGLTNFKAKHAK